MQSDLVKQKPKRWHSSRRRSRYKIKFDNNGKFDENSIDIIPEINWRHFYVSDMKHVYLFSSANDLKTNRSGLSYYDVEKLFKDRELSKYFIVKTTELEIA